MDIGRISFSTEDAGIHFGTAVILDNFHWSGTMHCLIDEFMIAQIGAARTSARFFNNLFEMRSGPVALFSFSWRNMLNTSISSIM